MEVRRQNLRPRSSLVEPGDLADARPRVAGKAATGRNADRPYLRPLADSVPKPPAIRRDGPDAALVLREAPAAGVLAVEGRTFDVHHGAVVGDRFEAAHRAAVDAVIEHVHEPAGGVDAIDETAVEIGGEELAAGAVERDVAQARAAFRAAYTAKDAPPFLGPPKPPPPDLNKLPPAAARVNRAMFIALDHVFGSSQVENEEAVFYGLAASKGVYEGPARRVSGPAEFDRIVKGDVLVTESTTEAFNILLPLLGGIVTDNGGLLSHAAIVAREYGIPGVVGTREATERIHDGDLVRVDGDAGEVTLLA